MTNITINSLPPASTIDGSLDILPIYTASSLATQGISRNTLLGLASGPLGLTDSQAMTNKTIGNTNTITLKDTLLTLQDDGDTSKQLKFQLSGITTATTRTLTVPDISDTLVTLTATQTLTNKTLTSPTVNSPTITNATLSADAITGFSSSSTGTIYGMSVVSGILASAAILNAVNTAALQSASVTPNKLALSPGNAVVLTSETTTSTSYTDLATPGPAVTVTVGANGLALVGLSSGSKSSTSGVALATYALSGANTVAASDTNIMSLVVGTNESISGSIRLFSGLTPGSTTFTMKYRVDTGTGTFERRNLTVIPL